MTTIKIYSTTVDAATREAVVVMGVWDSEVDWQQALPPNMRKELTLMVPGIGLESMAHIAEVTEAHDWAAVEGERFVADGAGRVKAKPVKPAEFMVWDWGTCGWVDRRTIEDLRATRWAGIKAERDAAAVAPLNTPYGPFQAGRPSQIALDDAARFSAGTGEAVEWTLLDNTTILLDATKLTEVQMLITSRTQDLRRKATTLRAKIDASQTEAEVQSVTWSASV